MTPALVDTHCHLLWLDEPERALDEAREAGVGQVVAVGVDVEDSRRCAAFAAAHDGVYAGAGHHPTNRFPPDLDALAGLARHPRVVAVGEVGLDLMGEDREPEAVQREWLHAMCEIALEAGLPVSVHTRESSQAVLEVLSAHPGLTGVMHYFSLDWEWARRFLEIGFHLSLSALITRPSREPLREVARRCPADRLLLETDAPYGSPHGRVREENRPAWMAQTARLVAELRGMEYEEMVAIEAANARRLFARMD